MKNESLQIPFQVGEAYFIRTITYHTVGRVTRIIGRFLELADAAWIPISSRFANFLRDGEINEAEPITGPTWLNVESIVDAQRWSHNLPLMQK